MSRSSPIILAAALLAARAAADAPSLSCGAGLCFASGLGSGMVLQQAPARAALYGSVPAGSPAAAAVSVSLNSTDGSGFAKVYSTTAAADGTWKVLLDARPGGGSYAARADCASCAGGGKSSNTLTDIVFGDVFFCSGQSNMWLPLWFTFERNETTARTAAGAYDNLRTITFLGCGAADLGLGASAQALGQVGSKLHPALGAAMHQGLRIGVGHDEFHALQTQRDHVVDGIGSTAAHADYGNAGRKIRVLGHG